MRPKNLFSSIALLDVDFYIYQYSKTIIPMVNSGCHEDDYSKTMVSIVQHRLLCQITVSMVTRGAENVDCNLNNTCHGDHYCKSMFSILNNGCHVTGIVKKVCSC